MLTLIGTTMASEASARRDPCWFRVDAVGEACRTSVQVLPARVPNVRGLAIEARYPAQRLTALV